ncbi:hypothetical protein GCM10009733_059690 [Nonomuraea maheshkhaliensis]|uniref:Uncharacterized protein n=1 Tax=Nonomuraea maheshkhaliensis TaxID=419590 RepID=A0ABN2FN88_9ACTN
MVVPNLGIAIVRQYERGVVFRPGKVRDTRSGYAVSLVRRPASAGEPAMQDSFVP